MEDLSLDDLLSGLQAAQEKKSMVREPSIRLQQASHNTLTAIASSFPLDHCSHHPAASGPPL